MKLSEFHTLTSEQLESLDTPTLKKLVSEQGKKLNKRIKNINKNPDANKSAVTGVAVSGGRFGVKDKTRAELLNEAKREQHFMDKKTSTVKGAVKVNDEISKKAVGMTSKEYAKQKGKEYKEKAEAEKLAKSKRGKLTKSQKKSIAKMQKKIEEMAKNQFNKDIGKAWDTFHKWKEENPAYSMSYNKEEVKQSVNDYAVNPSTKKKADDLRTDFNNNVIRYQKSLQAEQSQDSVWTTVDSTPFTDGSGLDPDKAMRMFK